MIKYIKSNNGLGLIGISIVAAVIAAAAGGGIFVYKYVQKYVQTQSSEVSKSRLIPEEIYIVLSSQVEGDALQLVISKYGGTIIVDKLTDVGGRSLRIKFPGSTEQQLEEISREIANNVPGAISVSPHRIPGPIYSASEDTSTWKTYRNEKYGLFEFKYPPDWGLSYKVGTVYGGDIPRNSPIIYLSNTAGDKVAELRVWFPPNADWGDSLEKLNKHVDFDLGYAKNYKEEGHSYSFEFYEEAVNNWTIVLREKIFVLGRDALKIVFQDSVNNQKSTLVYIPYKTDGVFVMKMSSDARDKRIDAVFSDILSTFKFIKSISPPSSIETELRYKILTSFSPIFFCDPDFYPVGRGDEQARADKWVAENKSFDEHLIIVKHNNLEGKINFSDAEKLLIYRDHKKLSGIGFEPGDGKYIFHVHTGSYKVGGFAIEGTIDNSGNIVTLKKTPAFNTCPICTAPK